MQKAGWEAIHWSKIGNPGAPDPEIFRYAREQGLIVFTHDLDFGTLLAVTGAVGPSVLQVRTEDVSPEHLASLVLSALHQFQAQLEAGAIVTLDEARLRARILPIGRTP